MRISRLFVIHPNGYREEIPLERALPAGATTRWIRLGQSTRCLRRIALEAHTGRSTPFPARLAVWAWGSLR